MKIDQKKGEAKQADTTKKDTGGERPNVNEKSGAADAAGQSRTGSLVTRPPTPKIAPAPNTPEHGEQEAQLAASNDAITSGAQTRRAAGVPQPVSLPLTDIKVESDLQCRAAIDKKVVEEYAGWMESNVPFPPVVVFNVGGKKLLTDGFHRFAAAKMAGCTSIAVVIHQGTRQEAIKFAIEANTAHGLRFSNKDKNHAVAMALREFGGQSDGWLADLCKVSSPFVTKVRSQLKTVSGCDTRIGRDGKKRKAPQKVARAKDNPGAAGPEDKCEVRIDGPVQQEHKDAPAPVNNPPAAPTAKHGVPSTNANAPLKSDDALMPLAELKAHVDHLYNIFDNSLRKQEGLKLIGKLQRELARWADWEAKRSSAQ